MEILNFLMRGFLSIDGKVKTTGPEIILSKKQGSAFLINDYLFLSENWCPFFIRQFLS
jgi:hypothetical protein